MVFKAFAALLTLVTVLSACPAAPPAPRQLPVEPGPPATKPKSPKKPAEAIFGRPDDNGRWLRLREVRFEEGKTFGWRLRLPCRGPVEYLEVMKLPGPSDIQFEEGELRETTVSEDKKTLTTHDYAACIDGWIEHSWSLAAEDPKGPWEITVTIAGYEPQVFKPTFIE